MELSTCHLTVDMAGNWHGAIFHTIAPTSSQVLGWKRKTKMYGMTVCVRGHKCALIVDSTKPQFISDHMTTSMHIRQKGKNANKHVEKC